MATKTAAELAIQATMEARDAVAGADKVGDAVKSMGRDVDAAGAAAQETARKLSITADSADDLGGKAGKATGALGALSSGFELIGPSGTAAAAGLQRAALATDFLSGVGDSLNLVMESTILQNARQRAATVLTTIATGAQTAAQWALNAAMSANPILLVVLGLVALTAAIVLAWKRSETFRNIVTGAFSAVRGAASSAFNWIRSNWPLLLAIITGPIGLAVLTVVKKWDSIKAAATATKKWITDRIGEIPGALRAIADQIEDVLTAPFKAIAKAVQKVLDLINKIKVPKLPDLNPFSRVAVSTFGQPPTSAPGRSPSDGGPPPVTVNVTVNGLVGDGDAIVQQIVKGINSRSRIFAGVGV